MIDLLPVVAEPTRLRILRLVWDRERGAGEIAAEFSSTFGAVSQHLGRLRDAGLVLRRREGRRLFYKADRERLAPLAALLDQLWAQQLGVLAELAEAEERHTAVRSARAPAAGPAVRSAPKPANRPTPASTRRSPRHARPRRRR